MRILALIPLAALTACGGGTEQGNDQAAATALTAGQYEVTREVTAFRSTDNAEPAIDAAVGTRTTENVCVTDTARPNGELFSAAGDSCEYGNHYMRAGRINSSLVCRRDGLDGELRLTADGNFTADSFEANVETTSYLTGDGDVIYTSQVSGRRTGECQAPPAGETAANQAAAR